MSKVLLFLLILTFNIEAKNLTIVDNNRDSIITIINEKLGKKAQKDIVDSLANQIIEHFSQMDKKLDNLIKNKKFIDYLIKQINISQQKNSSLLEELKKSEEQLAKAKEENIKNIANTKDMEYKKILQKAQKALDNYDEVKYREILDRYENDKKGQEYIKNLANSYYLKAKSYYRDIKYQKAELEISKAIRFDNNSSNYLDYYGYILYTLGEYNKAIKYYQKAIKIWQKSLPSNHPYLKIARDNLEMTKKRL